MITRIKKYVWHSALLLPLLILSPLSSQADITIISNKSVNVDSITPKQAKKLWLGRLKKLGGARVTVVDQTTSNKTFDDFYNKVIHKKPRQLKAYWAKIMFTGKGFPPKQLANDTAIIEWVSRTPGALGYVDSSAVNDTVKSLLTAKEGD